MCDNQKSLDQVNPKDIQNLLNLFAKNTYYAATQDTEANAILQRCIHLIELDYSVAVVPNNNGELSQHYPSQLPILEYEKSNRKNLNLSPQSQLNANSHNESVDVQKTHKLFHNARFSRCRTRFPVPVIIYKGKYICRSSTLSRGVEMYGRHGVEVFEKYFSSFSGAVKYEEYFLPAEKLPEAEVELEDGPERVTTADNTEADEVHFFDQARNNDITLLKNFNVGTIVDLMVENMKLKYGMYLSSSEKVEKDRYTDFNLICLPYPGCEFFKFFRDSIYDADSLTYDWNNSICDAPLDIPDDPRLKSRTNINWDEYRSWDLVTITQNYIKYILDVFQENPSGILVHCISGWDRTPLFISLLRMSLWADGMIHKSLDEFQILYLTIAYDWMLFGHHLPNRIDKGEEIFFFCFFMLKHLTRQEFASSPGRHKMKRNVHKTDDDYDNRNIGVVLEEEMFEMDTNVSDSSSGRSYESVKSQESNQRSENNGNDPNRDTSALEEPKYTTRHTSPVSVPKVLVCDDEEIVPQSPSQSDDFLMVGQTGSVLRDSPTFSLRNDRLQRVREIFYGCYFNSCASKVDYTHNTSPFGSFITMLAEKMGLFSKDPA